MDSLSVHKLNSITFNKHIPQLNKVYFFYLFAVFFVQLCLLFVDNCPCAKYVVLTWLVERHIYWGEGKGETIEQKQHNNLETQGMKGVLTQFQNEVTD